MHKHLQKYMCTSNNTINFETSLQHHFIFNPKILLYFYIQCSPRKSEFNAEACLRYRRFARVKMREISGFVMVINFFATPAFDP